MTRMMGYCEGCGNFSDLKIFEGQWLCNDCKDTSSSEVHKGKKGFVRKFDPVKRTIVRFKRKVMGGGKRIDKI